MLTTTSFKFIAGFGLIVAISLAILVATAAYDEDSGREIVCPNDGTACEAST